MGYSYYEFKAHTHNENEWKVLYLKYPNCKLIIIDDYQYIECIVYFSQGGIMNGNQEMFDLKQNIV